MLTPAPIVALPAAGLDALCALLQANGLPADDCAAQLDIFRGIYDGDRLIAAGGLEPAGECALLRSVVVHPRYRGRGLAGRMTAQLLALAEARGLAAVYLLTETAEGYFERRGFYRVPRDRVPQALRETRQFSSLCPQSAVCMRIDLPLAADTPVDAH